MLKKSNLAKWKVLERTPYSKCAVFNIDKIKFAHPDGRVGDFFVSETRDWVQCLALTDNNTKIVLVKQFRFGTQNYSLEPSGGIIDAGENPIDAALRELREETGYSGENAKLLATISPNPAIMSNKNYFVLVENCVKKYDVDFDANEEIESALYDIKDLDKLIESGQIHHCISISAIYFLEKYLRECHH